MYQSWPAFLSPSEDAVNWSRQALLPEMNQGKTTKKADFGWNKTDTNDGNAQHRTNVEY